SGLSTEESQNHCEDIPCPPLTKSKARKRRGHGWSRKKTSRSGPSKNSEDRATPTSKKRRIGEADAEDHELRPRKQQRVTELVEGPSCVVPVVPEGPQIAINGGTTRDHETNRNSETAVPGWAVERPRVNDARFTGPEVILVNVEEQEEIDFLLYAPGPFDYHPGTPVDTPTSASMSRYNSDPGTPGLMAEDNENRRGESNSPDSTPATTPHAQSIERSPTIITLGTIDEDQSYWAAEEGDEEEDEGDASESVVVFNRERSMAPSPPSLSPSHPTVHPATPAHVDEPQMILWPLGHNPWNALHPWL
ncbi:uncharacterized protein FOMMEDRAFT_154372, partial [Fomitiporia mediterranea MF3/22]|uniref:uncharacterized protein n=1 Tax=Fomitiporia mediterranea (strain MF3/22) TaxID=694068 RepID=UPI0004407E89